MHVHCGRSGFYLGWGSALVLLLFLVSPVHGQELQPKGAKSIPYQHVDEDWRDCGLRKVDIDAHVSRRPDPVKRQKASANIEVNYGDGFTAESRAAFERAVDVWETHISSPVTIRIDASFENLDSNVLGGAGPLLVAVDTTGNDEGDIIIGSSLFNALTGEDNFPDRPDISASFNRDRDDWHFGEEDAPSGTIDFTSVVLHEIAHGLDYIDVFHYNNGEGEYGIDFDNNGQIDEDERMPSFYAERVVEDRNGSFLFLTDEGEFPNPSEALGDALTSNQLFFVGEKSELAAEESDGPIPPKLYAPTDFDDGSSVSHLDETTYPADGSVNALMTPQIAHAETVRLPGPIACGQLRDMGWDVGAGCAFEDVAIEAVAIEEVEADPENQGRVELSWRLEGGAPVDSFVVEHQYFDQPFQERKRIPAEGPGEYRTTVEGLRPGVHTFRLSYVLTGGTKVQSGDAVTAMVEAQRPEVSVYPNPFDDVANVAFVLPERQNIRVEVYDALGRRVATPFVGERPPDDARPVPFDASRIQDLGSGVYFFRVIGDTFSETVKAVRVR